MTVDFKRAARAAILGLALAPLGACAIFDPYVGPNTSTDAGKFRRSQIVADESSQSDAELLQSARDYADRMDTSYRSAARQHAMTKTWLAFTTVGLAGGAAYHQTTGHAGDGNDFAAASALFGATAIQWADLLISSPRQGIYLVGSNAVLCAKRQSDPYVITEAEDRALEGGALVADRAALAVLVPADDVQYVANPGLADRVRFLEEELKRAKASKAGKAAARAAAVRATQHALDDAKAAQQAAEAEAEARTTAANEAIEAARDAIALADSLLDQGAAYQGRRHTAGLKLIATVDRIGNEIDLQVQKTEVSVTAIRAALNNAAFKPPAEEKAEADEEAAAEGGERVGVAPTSARFDADAVAAARARLLNDAVVYRRALNRLTAAEATAQADKCRVAGVAPLSVDAPKSDLAAGGELRVTIHGSEIIPPSASIDGDTKGLTSEIVVLGGGNYQAAIRAAAQGVTNGERTLVVESGDKAETQRVTFKVTGGAAAPAPDTTPATPDWADADLKAVLAFGLGEAGNDWGKALAAYAKLHGLPAPADGKPSKEIRAKAGEAVAINTAASADGKLTPYELWWCDKTKVRELQGKLGVTKTSVMDKATRDKLEATAKSRTLTADVVKKVMG